MGKPRCKQFASRDTRWESKKSRSHGDTLGCFEPSAARSSSPTSQIQQQPQIGLLAKLQLPAATDILFCY